MSYLVIDASFNFTTGLTTALENHTLAIRGDFVGGSGTTPVDIEFPNNITLLFEGGSFSDVTLKGNNTRIQAPLEKIFDVSVSLTGTFFYDTFYPEWYGAVGDNLVTDYAALSATCKNADHVTLTQQYHYFDPVEASIIVENRESFTLIGYGSLLSNLSPGPKHVDAALFTFKNIKVLTVEGLTIDGNFKMAKGIKIDDVPNATLRDINISNLRNIQSGDNALGIDIRVINGSVIHGDNIRISEIDGGFDDAIDNGSGGIGIARALYIKLDYNGIVSTDVAQKNTKITMNNSYFEWVYGDDGDVIDIIDETFTSDAPHRFIFTNCTIRYAFRRLVKGSASGIQYYNCKFDTARQGELREKMNIVGVVLDDLVKPSGGVNFRNANPAPTAEGGFPNFRNMHGKMINCEYRNSGNLSFGNGDTLIADYTNGLEIRGNRFYDSYVRFQGKTSNFIVDNNQFYNSNIFMGLINGSGDNINEWEVGRSYITNNYGRFDPANSDHSALIDIKNDLISVSITNNNVFSDESNNTVNFFGLLRHTKITETSPSPIAQDVNVSNNQIIRTNKTNVRREYLIATDSANWGTNCTLFNNFFNIVGPIGVGANFNSATPPNLDHFRNNRDGAGNEIKTT
jgi:hypothetical protein